MAEIRSKLTTQLNIDFKITGTSLDCGLDSDQRIFRIQCGIPSVGNETRNAMRHNRELLLFFSEVYSLFHWIAMSAGNGRFVQELFSLERI